MAVGAGEDGWRRRLGAHDGRNRRATASTGRYTGLKSGVTTKLSRPATRWVFVASLAILAATWLLTHSEAAQFFVLFATIYTPTVFLLRRVDGPDEHATLAAGLLPPWRLSILSLLLIAPLGVAIYFLSELVELGLFWFVALMWPWAEVYDTLTRREIERHGTATWKPERPLRDAATGGLITVPAIAALFLLFDGSAPLYEAILTGIACGVIVAVLALFFDWLDRRLSR